QKERPKISASQETRKASVTSTRAARLTTNPPRQMTRKAKNAKSPHWPGETQTARSEQSIMNTRPKLVGLKMCLLFQRRTNLLAMVTAAVTAAKINELILAAVTAAVTIASKFVLRWNSKHIFNPTNFGLVFMMLCSDRAVWVSPGQWGDFAFFAFLVICLGGLVVNRAARVDVTLAFLVSWLALIFGRSFW